jgi:hypothetical protein
LITQVYGDLIDFINVSTVATVVLTVFDNIFGLLDVTATILVFSISFNDCDICNLVADIAIQAQTVIVPGVEDIVPGVFHK